MVATLALVITAACGDDAGGSAASATSTPSTTSAASATSTPSSTSAASATSVTSAPSTTSAASATSAAPATSAGLEVTITHPADPEPVVYSISCDSGGATVAPPVDGVDGAAACARLADPEVRTRLVDGPPPDEMCTEIYGGPDEAHLVGELDGSPVDTTVDRANGCGIGDWDEVLSEVLPPAVGITG
jgi:hypothetical protein